MQPPGTTRRCPCLLHPLYSAATPLRSRLTISLRSGATKATRPSVQQQQQEDSGLKRAPPSKPLLAPPRPRATKRTWPASQTAWHVAPSWAMKRKSSSPATCELFRLEELLAIIIVLVQEWTLWMVLLRHQWWCGAPGLPRARKPRLACPLPPPPRCLLLRPPMRGRICCMRPPPSITIINNTFINSKHRICKRCSECTLRCGQQHSITTSQTSQTVTNNLLSEPSQSISTTLTLVTGCLHLQCHPSRHCKPETWALLRHHHRSWWSTTTWRGVIIIQTQLRLTTGAAGALIRKDCNSSNQLQGGLDRAATVTVAADLHALSQEETSLRVEWGIRTAPIGCRCSRIDSSSTISFTPLMSMEALACELCS